MKKVIVAVLAVALFLGTAGLAAAQEKKVNVSLNAGVQTNVFSGHSFDKALFTADARVGFLVGRSFEVAPEVMVVFNYLSVFFDGAGGTLVYPGVMLNYNAGNLFVGAGVVLPWAFVEGDSDTGNPAPKINIGYRFGNLQVTAYMIAWTESGMDFLDVNWVGATIGYRF